MKDTSVNCIALFYLSHLGWLNGVPRMKGASVNCFAVNLWFELPAWKVLCKVHCGLLVVE